MARLRSCPHCGGRLFFDEEEKEWYCINCDRRPDKPVIANKNAINVNNNLVPGKKIPISTTETPLLLAETPISTTKKAITTGDFDDSINKYITRLHKLRKEPARETPDTYKRHSLDGAWWPSMEITFRRSQVLWLIEHLPELREGRWPANPAGSGYVDLPMIKKGRTGRHRSYFEIPASIAAEVEVRLESCSMDGLILEALECWGKSEQSLAKHLAIPPWSIRKRANNALRYISGWKRKEQSYKEFLR